MTDGAVGTAGVADGASRSPRVRRVAWVASALVVFLYLLLTVSPLVLPRLASPCGRLLHVAAGLDSLATNQVRLDTPPARPWRNVELDYRIRPHEALTFVLDRVGDDYALVRLSRLPGLDSIVAEVRGNAIVAKRALGFEPGEGGHLRFQRLPGTIAVICDQRAREEVSSTRDDGLLEVTMFPPSSPDLHRRVTLGEVMLDGGIALPPLVAMERITSPGTLAIVAALAVWLARGRLRGAAARSLPYQRAAEPGAVATVLVCLLILLGAMTVIPRVQLLMSFTKEERLVYRTFASVVVALSFAFLALRDAVLRRWPRLRRKGLLRGILVPPLYVVFIAVCFVMLVILFDRVQIRTEPTHELTRPSDGRSPRIAILGGSSTRGYPFPLLWGASYPMVLERLLGGADGGGVIAWNLGVESATLSYLTERYDRWVTPLAPTHVVINNVANNAFGDPGPFRDGLAKLCEKALEHARHVILVKEPMLEVVYHAGRWASVGPFYPVLDEVAKRPGVTVLDPVPMLTERRDELLFMDDVHLTPQGHRRMAEALAAAIRQLEAVPAAAPATGAP